MLAQASAALDGNLDRIRQIARVAGYVNCLPDVTEIGAVINGASELFLEIFGERGAHARIAVGAMSMPLGVAVEIEAVMRAVRSRFSSRTRRPVPSGKRRLP